MTTRKRSTFLGAQRAIKLRYPLWQIHIQLYDLQPGEFWNPAHEAELLTPQVLAPHPTAGEALFFLRGPNFIWNFRIGPNRNNILCTTQLDIRNRAFFLTLPFGVHTFAYNSLTAPAANYAFNGSCTISWQRIP